jgi:DNA ligase-associated metallophosphoesterase
MSGGDVRVIVAGEALRLLPERAAYLEQARTLLVADAHVGKAAAFRAAGVLVPRGTTSGTLARLDAAIARVAPRRIAFLGDLLHAREGRAPETLRVLTEWRAQHAGIEMLLVRGNHDARAGDPPDTAGIACVDAPVLAAPFVLAHHPVVSAEGYVLAGHLHPGARLAGRAREHTRLPCFWFRDGVGVLPAFGEFTGLADIAVSPGDRVWVAAGDTVIDVSP